MTIATVNPASGSTEATFEAYTVDEVERRLGSAVEGHRALRAASVPQRAAWMRVAADLLDRDSEDVSLLITREMGKPLAQARSEVAKCADSMRFYADHAAEFLREQPLTQPGEVGATSAYTVYQPIGVVLAVMPWNYPLWQVIRFATPALMAGNAGLLKHASNVPQCALYLDTLFARAGFPDGAFQSLLIEAGRVEGLLRDTRIAAVTLTGSEPAGRSVGAIAGAEIKKSVLELGGSDAFIVMPTADVEAAISVAVRARTINNGQSCIAAKRFLIHSEIYDQFVDGFARAMSALVVGDPVDEATQIGPLATRSGLEEVAGLVADAIRKGAQALAGGSRIAGDGWFFAPTVLTGVTPDMKIRTEETFGPVAVVHRIDSLEEAISIANETRFGLSSSVWTHDAAERSVAVRELEAGAVFINGMTASYAQLPFGGVKSSGYGRELSAIGMYEFCNLKTVWAA